MKGLSSIPSSPLCIRPGTRLFLICLELEAVWFPWKGENSQHLPTYCWHSLLHVEVMSSDHTFGTPPEWELGPWAFTIGLPFSEPRPLVQMSLAKVLRALEWEEAQPVCEGTDGCRGWSWAALHPLAALSWQVHLMM